MFEKTYMYYAIVDRVVDGDTMDLNVDLGFGIWKKDRFRLAYIDTPEVYGRNACPEGKVSSDRAKQLCPVGSPVWITTMKDKTGKYGRFLAMVYPTESLLSVNEILLQEGLAKPY